jgi:hypothetical protein
MPTLNRHIIFKFVEPKIRGREHFGQQDDLTGVHREVFGDVEDGFEEFDVVALDFAVLQQYRWIEVA